jgi:alpha-mannosidase
MIERQPYLPTFGWAGANGDWPAVNWAGVEAPGLSVALFNQGLPSYRIEPGRPHRDVILLSVLRSPAIPTYLHEPEFYTMTLWDGMRDGGEHDFAFAISAYSESFACSPVTTDSESYNAGLLAMPGALHMAEMPAIHSGSARIAHVKMAEENAVSPHSALVVRLVETRGEGGEVTVSLPGWVKSVDQVNLLERQACPLPIEGSQVRLSLRPWEIATLKLSR